MTDTNLPSISIIEPTWNYRTHLPANLGLLRVVREAYPSAKIYFTGAAEQIELLKEMAPLEILSNVSFHAWQTGEDKDTLPSDVFNTMKKIRKLPSGLTTGATKIIFSSCTATILASITLLRLASKSYAVLHGNANDLVGWRSRNPFRRAFDFHSAMKQFCKGGGTPIVLEEVIRLELNRKLPWLTPRLKCLPHPIAPEEATPSPHSRTLSNPIKVAFAGNASIAKGFPEFIKLASALTHERPGQFEFHAFGYLPNESRQLDQSQLITKAEPATLPRDQYVENLRRMDYIFAWHNEKYYTMAASGIVYDAINLLVPLIARDTGQIAEWGKNGMEIGHTFNDIESTIKYFAKTENVDIFKQHNKICQNIEYIRSSISIKNLGAHASKIINIRSC